jgi:uncharacterized protein YcbX
MAGMTLTALYRYPVKSLRGASVEALDVGRRGFIHDREWMVVDEAGAFLTQRQLPRMALVSTTLGVDGDLTLSAPGMSDRVVADDGARGEVTVWRDKVIAEYVDAVTDAWLSDFLERRCRLVRLPADSVRQVDPGYAQPGDEVGFADGFAFLLISEASLDDLNGRLDQPVPMRRFRPNLVVSGCAPYAEDGWHRLRIGDITLRVVKPCSRCVIPTIDLETAERSAEPLRTLMGYRRRDNKVLFGQNLMHDGPGTLCRGMAVEVLG